MWICIWLLQTHSIVCYSGRRSDGFDYIKTGSLNKTIEKKPFNRITNITNVLPLNKEIAKDIKSNIGNKAYSEIVRNNNTQLNSDVAKIKTLLPYVILKRAYSTFRGGQYNNIKIDASTKQTLMYKSRQKQTSYGKLINSLCKQSATSICNLVSTTHTIATLVFVFVIRCLVDITC